jgi:hypothetical protein
VGPASHTTEHRIGSWPALGSRRRHQVNRLVLVNGTQVELNRPELVARRFSSGRQLRVFNEPLLIRPEDDAFRVPNVRPRVPGMLRGGAERPPNRKNRRRLPVAMVRTRGRTELCGSNGVAVARPLVTGVGGWIVKGDGHTEWIRPLWRRAGASRDSKAGCKHHCRECRSQHPHCTTQAMPESSRPRPARVFRSNAFRRYSRTSCKRYSENSLMEVRNAWKEEELVDQEPQDL